MKRNSILIANIYFFIYLAIAAWLPFYNLFLKDIGFSGTQTGLVAGLFQFTLFFIVPLWGALSDRFGNQKILRLCLAGSLVLLFNIQFIRGFGTMLLYMICLAFLHHPLGTLIDSLGIEHAHLSRKSSFGELRSWGSAGWVAGTVLLGMFLTSHSTRLIFPAASGFMIIALLFTGWLRTPKRDTETDERFTFEHAKQVFGNRRLWVLFFLLLFFGMFSAPLNIFINLYYKDIGASNRIIGFAFAIQALFEIPFFIFGKRLLKKTGAPRIILLSIFTSAFRMMLYHLISNPNAALLVGALQGFSLSLFWVGIVEYLHNHVPSRLRATAQSLIWAFYTGAGLSLGNITIGRLSDCMSMRQVMGLGAVAAGLLLVIQWIYFRQTRS